jgi:hypothetical protein
VLTEILRDAMTRSLKQYRASPDHWDGPDWWQLSREEAAVFVLEPQRWAELVPVWQAFEFFRGRTDGWNEEDIERDYPDLDAVMQSAREQHPEWVNRDPEGRHDAFLRFAKQFGGVSYREAHALFWKMDFWEVRTGVTWYADEQNSEPALRGLQAT